MIALIMEIIKCLSDLVNNLNRENGADEIKELRDEIEVLKIKLKYLEKSVDLHL